MSIYKNILKENGYHYTISDKINCHTCKNLMNCEDVANKFNLKLDRYHVCNKVDTKAQYKK